MENERKPEARKRNRSHSRTGTEVIHEQEQNRERDANKEIGATRRTKRRNQEITISGFSE